jgi:hypothetical protein
MAAFFTAEYQWLWIILLSLALFIPVRNLILTLAIKRALKKNGAIVETVRENLKKRASVTSTLLSFIFSYFYTNTLF